MPDANHIFTDTETKGKPCGVVNEKRQCRQDQSHENMRLYDVEVSKDSLVIITAINK